jgi:hypothetical protein
MVTIEILGDPKMLKALATLRRDFAAGRTYRHEHVWKDG